MKKLLLGTLITGVSLSGFSQTCITSVSPNPICTGQSATMTVISPTFNCSSALPANLQTGLKGYYPFCGNANDASGNSNNGTVTGATLTTDRWGNANSAYYFNGTTDYITVPHSASLTFTNNIISIALWVKYSSFAPVADNNILVSKQTGAGATQVGFNMFEQNANGETGLRVCNNGPAGTSNTGSISIGIYRHVVCTFNGSVSISYLNGVAVNTSTAVSAIGSNTMNLLFAMPNWVASNALNFHGSLDEIMIYNKALTPAEVSQIYNLGTNTYTWSGGGSSSVTVVSPTTTANYTVTASNGYNTCNTAITLTVNTCVGINEMNVANGISIYPNPNNGKFTVQIENETSNTELILYNSLGQKVFRENVIQGKNNIDLDSVPKGFYYAVLAKDKRPIATYKLIKE